MAHFAHDTLGGGLNVNTLHVIRYNVYVHVKVVLFAPNLFLFLYNNSLFFRFMQ